MKINLIGVCDVVYDGRAYNLEAASRAIGTRVSRATRRLDCNPRAHGPNGRGAIKSGDYFIWLRGEGRMCCRCAIGLGALEPVEPAETDGAQ